MKAKEFVGRTQSVGEFYQANKKDLQRMAAYILKRWPAPNDVGVEDVVQELLLACWKKRLKFDPNRGPTPEQFLSFNAISSAKRYVHRARRGRGDRAIGTFDLLTSTGDVDELDDRVVEPEAEAQIARREHLQALLAQCSATKEAVYLLVYEEDSARNAGDRVYKDGRLREKHRREHAAESRAAVKATIKEQRAWPE